MPGRKPTKKYANLESRRGTWWLRVRVRGKVHHFSLRTRNVEEALRLRSVWIGRLRAGDPRALDEVTRDDAPTVATFGKRWLDELVAHRRNEKGQKLAAQRFADFIKPDLGDVKLRDLRKGELHGFVARLELKNLSAMSVRHILADLRALLYFALDCEVLDKVPSFRRVLPVIPEEVPRRLTDEQVARILEVLPPQHAFTVRLALLTGLRYGELHRLQWRNVHLGDRPHLVIERAKSKKVRRVPLTTEAVALLREEFIRKRSYFVVRSRAQGAQNIYTRSAEACGFAWTFHQLRHTFATRFLEAGGSAAALKELLGHSTIRLTERYAKLSDEAVAAEMRRVNLGTGTGARTTGAVDTPEGRKVQ